MKMLCSTDYIEEPVDFDLQEIRSIQICRIGDVAAPEELQRLKIRPEEIVLCITFGHDRKCFMRPGWKITFEEESAG